MAHSMHDPSVVNRRPLAVHLWSMSGIRTRIVVDDSVLASRIGSRIRKARLSAGLTQQQLAAGRYTKAYISALEKGHAKPSMAALDFIAGRLGMPASRFLSEDTRWSRLEADLMLASGRWVEAADAYRNQLELAVDRSGRADALLGLIESLCRLDHGREAIGLAVEAVELLTALGRVSDAMLAGYWLAYAHFLAGNAVEARSLLQALLERSRQAGGPPSADLQMRLLMALGSVASDLEDHPAAVAYLEEARAASPDLDDRRRASMLALLATSRAGTGDMEGAIRAGLEGLALYRATQARLEAALLENNLAMAYLRVGNLTRAAAFAAEARAIHEADDDRRSLAHVLETEAQIALASDDTESALRLAREAMAHATASEDPRALSSSLLTIARAHATAGDTDAAIEAFARAAEALRRTGPVPRLQEALTGWADVLARLGRHREAFDLTREALQASSQTLDVGSPGRAR
jgi:transcriptional regulator with XRE-family HTH domain